jgi:hypothetical protein
MANILKNACEMENKELRFLYKSLNKRYFQLDKNLINKDYKFTEQEIEGFAKEMDSLQSKICSIIVEIDKRKLKH